MKCINCASENLEWITMSNGRHYLQCQECGVVQSQDTIEVQQKAR